MRSEAERRADPALLAVRTEEGPRAEDEAPPEAGSGGDGAPWGVRTTTPGLSENLRVVTGHRSSGGLTWFRKFYACRGSWAPGDLGVDMPMLVAPGRWHWEGLEPDASCDL